MTEVPDHLLKRSRDRRAALGLGGGEGGPPPGEPADAGAQAAPASPAVATPAAAASPAEVPAAAPPAPLPPYVQASLKRGRIPLWAFPVLGLLPVWAVIYAFTLSPPEAGDADPLVLGAEIYSASCASCHGGTGGGGVGRQLSDGEVLRTFPDIESMIEFVAIGSEGLGLGQPIGDPNREGGAHIAGTYRGGNLMPGFRGTLTDEELLAVVRYIREGLSGEELDPALLDAEGQRLNVDGQPLIVDGVLVTPEGDPLLDEEGRITIEIADSPTGGVGGQ